MNAPAVSQPRSRKKDTRVALSLAIFVGVMGGISFAAVPLYRMFCAATGYAGTPRIASAPSGAAVAQTVTVRFDSNVTPGLPWIIEPLEHEATLHLGENKLAFYRATNRSAEPVTGMASFNVSPDIMGSYFNKVQCFCFQEQTLAPGETIEMPVSFFVDPAALGDRDAKGIQDITLSYTFYRVKKPSGSAAVLAEETNGGVSIAERASGG